MQFTTQKTQRSFRSSFKKHLPTKFRSQSDSTSFDSSISSSDDVLSVESISSMNQKLSKREKFKSFFSHSRSNTDATFANSSTSYSNDSASIQSITSQGKTLSKREKFKSFFLILKNQLLLLPTLSMVVTTIPALLCQALVTEHLQAKEKNSNLSFPIPNLVLLFILSILQTLHMRVVLQQAQSKLRINFQLEEKKSALT